MAIKQFLVSYLSKQQICQTFACLPRTCYRFHSDKFLLALPVRGGYQTHWDHY